MAPSPQYLAQYEGYTLPGYVQGETFESTIKLSTHDAPYADGQVIENVGLQNKSLSLKMKVWGEDYADCKDQIQQAATILRKKRQGFGTLRIMYADRHYEAMPKSIRMDKSAGSSTKIVEYDVELEAKPWLIGDTLHTITGTSLGGLRTTLSTAARTIDDGGWSYATVTLTGTDITVSGYTNTVDYTGFISVSGAVTGLVIDSENYSATIGVTNKNSAMRWADYRMYVGPETTYFVVSGATSCEITYYDRWYI